MKAGKMPARDIIGECEGECRDRVKGGVKERREKIRPQDYSEPLPDSPEWTRKRNDPPGSRGRTRLSAVTGHERSTTSLI